MYTVYRPAGPRGHKGERARLNDPPLMEISKQKLNIQSRFQSFSAAHYMLHKQATV